MCGIYSIINYQRISDVPDHKYYMNFMKTKNRGPDSSKFEIIDNTLILGHHRLSINGLGESGDQPIHRDGVYLIANAEIYNWKELYDKYHSVFQRRTNSDSEVILEL